MRMGRIRVGGAIKKVSLELLTDAERGDTVLLADGVAISEVRPGEAKEEKMCLAIPGKLIEINTTLRAC